MADRPDLEKFLTDPAFQADRALIEGVVEKMMERKQEEARQKAANEPQNIFDVLFGGK